MFSYFNQMLKYVWVDVVETMKYFPVGFLVFLIILIVNTIYIKKWKLETVNKALLISYIVVLCFITFFSRKHGARDGIDLLPFATVGNGPQGDAYVLENILLFIPLGILLPLVLKGIKTFSHCTAIVLSVSLVVEMSQYITKRGYVQTDDVIMNTLGGILGYMVYKKMWHLIKKNRNLQKLT